MIGPFSSSVSVTLNQDAAGLVTIASQEAGFVPGLVAELTGLVNGGKTTSVGMTSTVANVAKMLSGVAVANKTQFTKTLPVIGEPRG